MVENEQSNLLYLIVILLIGIGLVSLFFGGGMMMGGMMGIGLLLPILLIIFLVYALSDRDRPACVQHSGHDGNDAIHVLERRYANGEISREEYFRKKNDLNN